MPKDAFRMLGKLKQRKTSSDDHHETTPTFDSLEEVILIPPSAFEILQGKKGYQYLENGLYVSEKKISLESLKNKEVYKDFWECDEPDFFSRTTYDRACQITKIFDAKMLTLAEYFCVVDYLEKQNSFDAEPMLKDMTLTDYEWLENWVDRINDEGQLLITDSLGFDRDWENLSHINLREFDVSTGYFDITDVIREIGMPKQTLAELPRNVNTNFYWHRPEYSSSEIENSAMIRYIHKEYPQSKGIPEIQFVRKDYWGMSGVRLCYKAK